jgi:uncharacterized RDD family membrane protein YckC
MAAMGAKTTGPVVVIFEPGYLFATAGGNVHARRIVKLRHSNRGGCRSSFVQRLLVPPCVTTRPPPQ